MWVGQGSPWKSARLPLPPARGAGPLHGSQPCSLTAKTKTTQTPARRYAGDKHCPTCSMCMELPDPPGYLWVRRFSRPAVHSAAATQTVTGRSRCTSRKAGAGPASPPLHRSTARGLPRLCRQREGASPQQWEGVGLQAVNAYNLWTWEAEDAVSGLVVRVSGLLFIQRVHTVGSFFTVDLQIDILIQSSNELNGLYIHKLVLRVILVRWLFSSFPGLISHFIEHSPLPSFWLTCYIARRGFLARVLNVKLFFICVEYHIIGMW